MTGSVACPHGFIEGRESAFDIASACFGFSKRNLEQSVEDQDVLLAQKFDPATHLLEPAAGCASLSTR